MAKRRIRIARKEREGPRPLASVMVKSRMARAIADAEKAMQVPEEKDTTQVPEEEEYAPLRQFAPQHDGDHNAQGEINYMEELGMDGPELEVDDENYQAWQREFNERQAMLDVAKREGVSETKAKKYLYAVLLFVFAKFHCLKFSSRHFCLLHFICLCYRFFF